MPVPEMEMVVARGDERQMSFAVVPLVVFTSSRKKMGRFVSPFWVTGLACVTAAVIISLNVKYLSDYFGLSDLIARLEGFLAAVKRG